MQKATAEMLIARKLQGDYDRLQVKHVDVPSMGFCLELRKPKIEKVLNLLDDIKNTDSTAENTRYMQELIYEACPMLHNRPLQETFDCKEPADIVIAVLGDDYRALNTLAEHVLDFYGLGELDDAVKN
ncbi:MAG: hypothetical protein IIV26_04550 [Peptococcaceae bacterium]|nr:hypothetical protein [Peptococcaceae bacterium]